MDLQANMFGRSFRDRRDGLRLASGVGMAIAAALMCPAPATGGSQDEIRIKNISSVDSTGMPAEATGFLVRTARVPIFVDIDLGGGGAPRLPGTAVDDVMAVLDANPRRLVTLRFKGGALRFDDLAPGTRETLLEKRGQGVVRAYNEYLAGQVLALTKAIDSERPRAPLAIQGIPFEGRDSEASKANEVYREVLLRMNAIVLGGGMMVSGGSEESSMLLRAYPHAVDLADGRAILFASNGGWRIATPGAQTDDSALAVDDSLESVADIPLESPTLASADSNDAMGEAAVLGSPSSGDFPAGGGVGDTSSQGAGSDVGSGVGDAGSPAAQGVGSGGGAGGGGGGTGSGGSGSGGDGVQESIDGGVVDPESDPVQPFDGAAGGGSASEGSSDDDIPAEGDDETDPGSEDSSDWEPEDEVDVPDSEGDDADEDQGSSDAGSEEDSADTGEEESGSDDSNPGSDGGSGDEEQGDSSSDEVDGDLSAWRTPAAAVTPDVFRIDAQIEDIEVVRDLIEDLGDGGTLDLGGRAFAYSDFASPLLVSAEEATIRNGIFLGGPLLEWRGRSDGLVESQELYLDEVDVRVPLCPLDGGTILRMCVVPRPPEEFDAFRFCFNESWWIVRNDNDGVDNGVVLTTNGDNAFGDAITGLRIDEPSLRAEIQDAIGEMGGDGLQLLIRAGPNLVRPATASSWNPGTGTLVFSEESFTYRGYLEFCFVGNARHLEDGEYAVDLRDGRVIAKPGSVEGRRFAAPVVGRLMTVGDSSVTFEDCMFAVSGNQGGAPSLVASQQQSAHASFVRCNFGFAPCALWKTWGRIEDCIFGELFERAVTVRDGSQIISCRFFSTQNKEAIMVQPEDGDPTPLRQTRLEGCYISIPASTHGQGISLYSDSWQNAVVRGNVFANCKRSISFGKNANEEFLRPASDGLFIEDNLFLQTGLRLSDSGGQSGVAYNAGVDAHLGPEQVVVIRGNTFWVSETEEMVGSLQSASSIDVTNLQGSDVYVYDNVFGLCKAAIRGVGSPHWHSCNIQWLPASTWGSSLSATDIWASGGRASLWSDDHVLLSQEFQGLGSLGGTPGISWGHRLDDGPLEQLHWSGYAREFQSLSDITTFAEAYFNETGP